MYDKINIYHKIKWLGVGDVDTDMNDLNKIREYISSRIARRKNIPGSVDKHIVAKVIDADVMFLSKMDKQHRSYSNDEEI